MIDNYKLTTEQMTIAYLFDLRGFLKSASSRARDNDQEWLAIDYEERYKDVEKHIDLISKKGDDEMTIAEETRMRILVKQSTMILSAIEIALEESIDYDENRGGEHDLTFVFTYSDDSQLRIDTRGDIYDDSNVEVNNLYGINGRW